MAVCDKTREAAERAVNTLGTSYYGRAIVETNKTLAACAKAAWP